MKHFYIPLKYLSNLNDTIVYQKNTNNLDKFIQTNEKYLNILTLTGGTISKSNMFKSTLTGLTNTINELISQCSTQKCDQKDYTKIFAYINYNLALLDGVLDTNTLHKLKSQINELQNIIPPEYKS